MNVGKTYRQTSTRPPLRMGLNKITIPLSIIIGMQLDTKDFLNLMCWAMLDIIIFTSKA